MLKVGIFFGGNSREREVSFAGGRTVYDNLDKSLFHPIPIFVDSWGNFCLLNWHLIYKGSIRDFYPPPSLTEQFQVYAESLGDLSKKAQKNLLKEIGTPLSIEDLKDYIDIAFLALHGKMAEDGTLQGMLDWLGIPYTGCGILPSAIGINKSVQKEWQSAMQMPVPKYSIINRNEWQLQSHESLFKKVQKEVGFPCVVKSATQGSSIGVSVVKEAEPAMLKEAIEKSFFILKIKRDEWLPLHDAEKNEKIKSWIDIREGLGLPVKADGKWVYSPLELIKLLDRRLRSSHEVELQSGDQENEVIVESFIQGREFSCIVVDGENEQPLAMPPTEIVKSAEVYTYRSKYLPGLSRKVTPMEASEKQVQAIREQCCELYKAFHCNVYARIDGFLSDQGEVFLNDPNTTSGMMPSSFFFHQAAEIGLEPARFLTFIIRSSLKARMKDSCHPHASEKLYHNLDRLMINERDAQTTRTRVAVIMGGYSSERHISVESGRNIYEKLSSSTQYTPIPVFLTGNQTQFSLYRLPVNVMLKDNADDIKEKLLKTKENPLLQKIRKEFEPLIRKYCTEEVRFIPEKWELSQLKENADAVFIALHGRPGEDGTLQLELEKLNLPYNGSGPESSATTINKYETNNILRESGFPVAESMLIGESDWLKESTALRRLIQVRLGYPLIAKPVDDGCSSAVCRIENEAELDAFARCMFRKSTLLPEDAAQVIKVPADDEFPIKNEFLLEQCIEKGDSLHFLEITGGFITHYDGNELVYEMFDPSETLASKSILSLEEKFLAGQGQNITPPRYSSKKNIQKQVGKQVKMILREAAKQLGVEGYARIDAFVRIEKNGSVKVHVIEINSLPGMTPATAIFHQCALNGYKPYDFIHAILQFGMERMNKNKHHGQG